MQSKTNPNLVTRVFLRFKQVSIRIGLYYKLIISENPKSHYQNHDHIGQHHESLGSVCICPYEFTQALIFNLFG